MREEKVVFETDSVGKIKIFYKNDTTYTLTDVNEFVVVRRIGGGCDIEYTQVLEREMEYGLATVVVIHQTDTQDVVAFEANNVTIFGMTFSKIYQRLK